MNKEFIKRVLDDLDYYTPFLAEIPEVQSPDCTRLFQLKSDLIHALNAPPEPTNRETPKVSMIPGPFGYDEDYKP